VLKPQYPIRTDRLVLRPFAASDVEDLFDIYRRPEVARYLYWEPFSWADAVGSLEEKLDQAEIRQEGERLTVAVVLPELDRVIGVVTLKWLSQEHRQGEIGFSFHPDHHGHGYATEAAGALVDLGFRGLHLHRTIGQCDARNTASVGVMERLGMRREAHFVQNEIFKGGWGDEFVYAILEDDWRARA
jgi:RimJ/RimL family protein N-acetyltransferase